MKRKKEGKGKMKKIALLCLVMVTFSIAALIFSIAAYTSAYAEDYPWSKDFTFSADYAFYTQYVGKGFTWDKDPVLQAGFYLGFKGLTLTVWNSQDIRNQEEANSDEVDYVAEYAYAIDKLKLSIGHAYFDYPGSNRVAIGDDSYDYTNKYSKELSVGIAYDTFLSPSLSWKHDYSNEDSGGAKGDYVAIALAQSFPITKAISADLSGHVGYNDGYYIDGTGGDVGLTAGLSIPLTEKLTFKPNVNYALPYGDMTNDEKNGGYDNDSKVYAGVVMGYSF